MRVNSILSSEPIFPAMNSPELSPIPICTGCCPSAHNCKLKGQSFCCIRMAVSTASLSSWAASAWYTPERHQAITVKLVDVAPVGIDDFLHNGKVAVEFGHDSSGGHLF